MLAGGGGGGGNRFPGGGGGGGGGGGAETNWEQDWYLGAGPAAALAPLGHQHLLALIAPRPFLLVAGECPHSPLRRFSHISTPAPTRNF